MAKTHITLRLTDESLNVIQQYQSEHSLADRTDAVEGIITDYWKMINRPLSRIRHALLGDGKTKPLEAFATAQA